MKLAFLTQVAAAALTCSAWAASAQEITGTPGAPDATTTLDGRYLPNPPTPFGGEIGLSAKDSKPYWPPQVVPPKGAPNILLIMTDDVGYGVAGTFGGVVPTPALDREGPDTLPPSKHTIEFDFTSDSHNMGSGGTGILKVDGKEVANQKIPHTVPALMPWDETFDVGVDTRTGVDDKDYQVPFAFTGTIDKLTVQLN
ncbi:hypothetical protein FHT77_005019 [Rhizobium sp. BK181]|nr:hypothetical protein [Rhizobium sp. BK181]